jgi:hypothetical protein
MARPALSGRARVRPLCLCSYNSRQLNEQNARLGPLGKRGRDGDALGTSKKKIDIAPAGENPRECSVKGCSVRPNWPAGVRTDAHFSPAW